MNLHKCILTCNDCYRAWKQIKPRGVMVHSTGANNPTLRRYVQPDDGLLGTNKNKNDWNRPDVDKCVHAFIGKLKDGTVATYQTLPWDRRGWHAGVGPKGLSANNTHISFEICEDDLEDRNYFEQVYREAVELVAMLCEEYGLNPLEEGVVICHSEGYRLGIANGHADVEHWFPRFGKTMDDFRKDVAKEMEDEDMTQEKFNEMMDNYLKGLAKAEPDKWSAKARAWAEKNGIISGDDKGNKMYKKPCTREELVQILFNMKEG